MDPAPISQSTDEPPALWNPNAAACWSLLFTPAFGAFLHARNAEALGREDEARANRVWFKVSIAYLVLAIGSIFIPAIPEAIFQMAAIGLLLGWYFSVGINQVVYVKETWRDGYERMPWKGPLLIGLGCLLGVFIAAFVLAVLAEIFASR